MRQYDNAVSSEMKNNILTQIKDVNESIIATSQTLETLGAGLTEEDYIRLQIYEEELAYYNETFERINLLTRIANTKPTRKFPNASTRKWKFWTSTQSASTLCVCSRTYSR